MQPAFFAGESHEHNPAARLLAGGDQPLGRFHQRGGAGGVVVGPVMDFLGPGSERAWSAEADVVVVGADHDRLVGERALPSSTPIDVFHLGLLLIDRRFRLRLPAGEFLALRREGLVDLRFDRQPGLCRWPVSARDRSPSAGRTTPAFSCGRSLRPRRRRRAARRTRLAIRLPRVAMLSGQLVDFRSRASAMFRRLELLLPANLARASASLSSFRRATPCDRKCRVLLRDRNRRSPRSPPSPRARKRWRSFA